MSKKKFQEPAEGHFGDRLAELRRVAGFSQSALGKTAGVARRMIAYYEGRAALPPGHVLSALAEALGVSVDALVGKVPAKPTSNKKLATRPLLRRLQQLEKLPLRDKREILSIIDTYLERNRLLQKAS